MVDPTPSLFVRLLALLFSVFKRQPDPQRDAAAHAFRAALNKVRGELDPQSATAAEHAVMAHMVVLPAIGELAVPYRDFRAYLPEGKRRDELDEAWNEFKGFAESKFGHRNDGPLSYFVSEYPPEAIGLHGEQMSEAINKLEGERRTEAIGYLDRLIDVARHR